MFDFISTKLSGFKSEDSSINQLLSITTEYMLRLIKGYKVRGVFLDISKAFDKVYHESLIFKLEQNEISRKLLRLIKDFLSDRKQRVVLNGQYSCIDVQVGVL